MLAVVAPNSTPGWLADAIERARASVRVLPQRRAVRLPLRWAARLLERPARELSGPSFEPGGDEAVWWAHPDPPPTMPNPLFRFTLDGRPVPSPLLGLPSTLARDGDVVLALERWGAEHGWRVQASVALPTERRNWRRLEDALVERIPLLFDWSETVPGRDRREPGLRALVGGAATLVGRTVRDKLTVRSSVDQWQIGFRYGGTYDDPNGFTWLTPPTDRFWADPFLVVRDGRTYVFFEELFYADWRGQLLVMELDRNGPVGEPKLVASPDYHLSWPLMVEDGGELWMFPESGATGQLERWRCVQFPDQWEPHDVVVSLPLADPVPFQRDGQWWMLATLVSGTSTNAWDNLILLSAPELAGPWERVSEGPERLGAYGSRMAGQLLQVDGHWVRPGQDCGGRYGAGLRFFAVDEVGPNGLVERAMGKWPAIDGELGRHTLNRAGELWVTDRLVRVRR